MARDDCRSKSTMTSGGPRLAYRGPGWLAAGAAVIAGLAGALPARALEDSPYTVAKISVDVTDKSAVAAKNKAIAQAGEQALYTVLSRVVPFSALSQVPALPPQTAEALVNGLSIRKEQYSTTRYIATLDIILNEQGVKQLLAAYGVPTNDARAPMISVLPVTLEGDKVKAGNDAWRQAWLDIDVGNGLAPANVLRPRPDLEAGTVRAVLAGDTSAYASLQGQYGSAPLVVAIGEPVGGGQFVTRLAGEDGVGRINYGRSDQIGGEAADAAARDAAAFAYAVIENRWKAMQSSGGAAAPVRYQEDGTQAPGEPQGEPPRNVIAVVPFSGLKEWQDIRARLDRVPGIQGLEVNSLSPRMASITFDYPGSLGVLQKVLGDYGFAFENRDENFVLRPR
jgi:Uncharacterized protein conserved in bacteria (DUF2066)